jgi:hypothetical protein
VALRKRRYREVGKEVFDLNHRLRTDELRKGDLVLRHDTAGQIDKSSATKLAYKWLGPYKIKEAIAKKGTYTLEELDGTLLSGTYAGNRLKRFFLRQGVYVSEEDTASDLASNDSRDDQLQNSDQLQEGPLEQRSASPPPIIPIRRPDNVIVRPPGLTQSQKEEYVRFEEVDSDGDPL